MKYIQRYLTKHRATGAHVVVEPFSTGDSHWWAILLHKPSESLPGIAGSGSTIGEAMERLEKMVRERHPNLISDAEKRVVQVVSDGWFYLRSKDHRSIDMTRQFATAEEAAQAAESSAALGSLLKGSELAS